MSSEALPVLPSATAALEALRAQGAHRFDPVGFRHIEAMVQRAASRSGAARQLLEQRLAQLVAGFASRFTAAQEQARVSVAAAVEQHPAAAAGLRERCATGDLGGLRRDLAQLQARHDAGGLAELLARFDAKAVPDQAAVPTSAAPARHSPPGELKAVRHFHRTWSRLRVDQQLLDAIERAPKQAGPLNSHHLVLQALRLMRDISPDYLEQFVSHIDALLWLQQASAAAPGQKAQKGQKEKEPKRAKTAAKRGSRRS